MAYCKPAVIIPVHIAARYGIYDTTPYSNGEKSDILSDRSTSQADLSHGKVHPYCVRQKHIECQSGHAPQYHQDEAPPMYAGNTTKSGVPAQDDFRSVAMEDHMFSSLYSNQSDEWLLFNDDVDKPNLDPNMSISSQINTMCSPNESDNVEWFNASNANHVLKINHPDIQSRTIPLFENDDGVEHTVICGIAMTLADYDRWYDGKYPPTESNKSIIDQCSMFEHFADIQLLEYSNIANSACTFNALSPQCVKFDQANHHEDTQEQSFSIN